MQEEYTCLAQIPAASPNSQNQYSTGCVSVSSRATRGWEKFYTAFARKWRRGCQAYPRGGCRGNFRALCTCVNVTFPAAQRVVSLKGYSLASILPWDSLGLRPAIQSVRYAFAQAVRLSTVLWESISEGKAKAEGHAKRTPVR